MLLVLGLIGILGVSGMTWLCPTIGAVWATATRAWKKTGRGVVGARGELSELVVAIPAYNEAQALPKTLQSIAHATEKLRSYEPTIRVRVIVGNDGSFDRTAARATAGGAAVISVERSEGKWRMLRRLVDAAGDADAIVFADAGVEWPRELLLRLLDVGRSPNVLGVAPGYRIRNGGAFRRALWWLERMLKTLENCSGGPVSVHGATVMYRIPPLREAFAKLADTDFLNDDVIIPLTLRRLFPWGHIVYLPTVVVTDEVDPRTPERRRRSRLMQGNLQCLRQSERGDARTEIVAARRVFRLFWVYWGTLVVAPVVVSVVKFTPPLGIASLGVLVGALLLPWKAVSLERFLDAAVASFRAPFELLRLCRNGTSSSGGTLWR